MRPSQCNLLLQAAARRRRNTPIGLPLYLLSPSACSLRTQGTVASPQQDAINYGPIPDELKPKPNPAARQLHPDQPQTDAASHQAEAAGGDSPKTIGDALEEAGRKAAEKPLEVKDTRAIQSAEARATGAPSGVMGGPSAYAANLLHNQPGATLGDALKDAKEYLPADKVATQRDGYRVMQAEARNDPRGEIDAQGVAAAVQEAVEYNKDKGFIPQDNAATNPLGRGRGAGGAA